MSIKRMVTKLALAFAAKKGMEIFNNVGGLSGLKNALQGNAPTPTSRGGMHGRIGETQAADSGGLGNILGSLGHAGATNGRESGVTGQISPLDGSLGTLFGSLANAFGGSQPSDRAGKDLDAQFDMTDIQSDAEATPMMRAMVQMARADGAIDADEQEALLSILDDASPEEHATLKDALREPVNPAAIAHDTPPHARKEVYSAALLIGEPDKPAERRFLKTLAEALRLRNEDVESLHRAMGKPVLA